MAKKTSRRPNLPQETLARARQELYGGPATTPAADEPVEAAPKKVKHASGGRQPARPARAVDLRQEYAYVVSDLQNMGILAAVLMLLLIVFSFFI